MIRVLIVEDSITQREIFRRLINEDAEMNVVGEARSGEEAIEQVEAISPDVVLMDIHMPGIDGIAATAEIMSRHPVPVVVASSTLKREHVDLAMQAYDAGAVAVIEKPKGAVLIHLKSMGGELRRELIAASKAQVKCLRVGRKPPTPKKRSRKTSNTTPLSSTTEIIGVCASTGGPPVLMKILGSLPKPFPIPILLVQHISHGFEEGFCKWLSFATGQSVNIAENGQRITPGVWIAPGGKHLTVGGARRFELPAAEASDIHQPSGNPLFESLGRHFAAKAVGVQLTGMGDDGAAGLLSLKEAGGTTIVQNEATSLIWGMPKAAQQLGAAVYEMTPEEIAAALSKLTK